MNFGFDFNFEALQTQIGLHRLDRLFVDYLGDRNTALQDTLLRFRSGERLNSGEYSEWMIHTAPILETFISELFLVNEAVNQHRKTLLNDDPIFEFKKDFVLKRAKRALNTAAQLPSFEDLNARLQQALIEKFKTIFDEEWQIAVLAKESDETLQNELIQPWCVQALASEAGRAYTRKFVSFKLPEKRDYENLVPVVTTFRHREGFGLTDERMSLRQVANEVHYCIYCHDHDGDFCSKGFPTKKGDPSQGLKSDPLGNVLTGCPLEEKISEMHYLRRHGFVIAPLAVVMIDNPMCPATGHRICNDCMKGCIYQKQDPVNIPEIETRVLTDVLHLPYGVEMYHLLTQWNPLRQTQWLVKPFNQKKALIIGMGPAGYTLSHHLLMEGCLVIGIDGLKIEPLPRHLIDAPVVDFKAMYEPLDKRVVSGLGGVAEYGITVRWDKNFLKLIYLTLARRTHFAAFGGVRFGGTLTLEDAFYDLKFDHVAICVGAGLPKALPIPNSLANGMRQANDFLMALQLSGAAKKESIASLQVELPAVVIGGGLTGVDTATELQAYYLIQIEKVATRYQALCARHGADTVRSFFGDNHLKTLDTFLSHYQALQSVREQARAENKMPDYVALLRNWGGVSIVYRKKMQASPAYRSNHEELQKALEEGIYYLEDLTPVAVEVDEVHHTSALLCASGEAATPLRIPARNIYVATGANPNVAYGFEHADDLARKGFHYLAYTETEAGYEQVSPPSHVKAKPYAPFTSFSENAHRVSFLGDTHPQFHGNVVKAIASAKLFYPQIINAMQHTHTHHVDPDSFIQSLQDSLSATVLESVAVTEGIQKLRVRAPQAAKAWKPGQFFRVQNYETASERKAGTLLQTETIPMVPCGVDEKRGEISFLVWKVGASRKILAAVKVGDPLMVMGPTGVRTKVPEEKQSLLILAEDFQISYVLSVGAALKAAGHHVMAVISLPKQSDVCLQKELEAVTDCLIWVGKEGEQTLKLREKDFSYVGSVTSALLAYSKTSAQLSDVKRISVMGDACFIHAFKDALANELKEVIQTEKIYASVSASMQCMLKGVCAQCLQWQIDPVTGKRTKAVFACSWQDQPLNIIDIDNLEERQGQNKVVEKIHALWVGAIYNESVV